MDPDAALKHSPVVLHVSHILEQFDACLADAYGALRQLEQHEFCRPADWRALQGSLERAQEQATRLATFGDPQCHAAE